VPIHASVITKANAVSPLPSAPTDPLVLTPKVTLVLKLFGD
jgi:hypothetical protein